MCWNKPPSSKALKIYGFSHLQFKLFQGFKESDVWSPWPVFFDRTKTGFCPWFYWSWCLSKLAPWQILWTLRTPNQGRCSQNLRCSYFSITSSHATPSWKYFKIIQHLATLRLKLATGPCPTIPFMFGAGLSGEGRGLRSGSVMNWLVCNGFRNHMINNDNYQITMFFCKHHITSVCCLYSYDTYLAIFVRTVQDTWKIPVNLMILKIVEVYFGGWWTEYPPGFALRKNTVLVEDSAQEIRADPEGKAWFFFPAAVRSGTKKSVQNKQKSRVKHEKAMKTTWRTSKTPLKSWKCY